MQGWSAKRILEGYGEHLRRTPKYTRPNRLIRSGVDVQDMNRQCFEYVSRNAGDSGMAALLKKVYGDMGMAEGFHRHLLASWLWNFRRTLRTNPWEPKDRREDRGYVPIESESLSYMATKHNIEPRDLRRWCEAGMPHHRSGKLLYVQDSVVIKWKNREYRHKKVKNIRRNRQKQSKICPESARSAA